MSGGGDGGVPIEMSGDGGGEYGEYDAAAAAAAAVNGDSGVCDIGMRARAGLSSLSIEYRV
jgi:hypothetical protein